MRRYAKGRFAEPSKRRADGEYWARYKTAAFGPTNGGCLPSPTSSIGRSDASLVPAGFLAALAALLSAALFSLGVATTPAQAGSGWTFQEAFGSAEEPSFGRASQIAVGGDNDLYVVDTGANEQQRIAMSATAGQFRLTFKGETTGDLAYNASATTVRNALRALPAIGSTGVNVAGTAGVLYTVTFQGTLAQTDVEQLVCTDGATPLSGGTGCSVETSRSGAHWGIKRFNPDGTPAKFTALGTNLIDGSGAGQCPTVQVDCDQTPDNKTAGDFADVIAIDRSGGATDGNIYLADTVGNTVDVFSAEGLFIGQLTGSTKGALIGVASVTVDEGGNVFVLEKSESSTHGEWVQKYDPVGDTPTNADNVASFEVQVCCTPSMVAGVGPSNGALFLELLGGVIKKLDSETGEEVYVFGSGKVRTVDPTTGHLFSASGNRALEWDASGSAAPQDIIAEVQDAGSTVQGLAVANGAETLYLTGQSVTKVDTYKKIPIPEATIKPPVGVAGAKATVAGTVNPEGVEVSECFFEYGKTTSYGSTAPCKEELPEDSAAHEVSAQLTGMLANGQTYHYRLVVKGGLGGQDASADETLVTAETMTADAATEITQTGATLRGTVRAEGLQLTDCRFEWGETTDYRHSVACDPHFSAIPSDDADHSVKGVIKDLDPSAKYHYRLVAENAVGEMVSAERTLFTYGKPRIVLQIPTEVRQTTATLQATINPAGAPTSYHFEWGHGTSYSHRIPTDHELFAGAGTDPVTVQANIAGLQPVDVYQFRMVAANSSGATIGPDQPFETLGENDLPEERAFELVTPASKGASAAIADSFSATQFTQGAENGERFMYPLLNGLDNSTAGGWLRYNARRTDSGWLSDQISGPALVPPPSAPEFGVAMPSRVEFVSPQNSCALVESYNPLTEDTPQASVELGVRNLYRWTASDGDYDLVSNRLPLNPELVARYYSQVEASDDCSRIYFQSPYEFINGASGLYEWDEGTLRDAGVLPNQDVGDSLATGASAVLGGQVDVAGTARWDAVSPDGARVFFTAISNEGPSIGKPAIFMRKDDPSCEPLPVPCVIEITASETAVPTKGARFEAASSDGSTVIFRANYGIDAQASSGGPTDGACGPMETDLSNDPQLESKPCDLYAFQVDTEELIDLSPDTNPVDAGTGAQVQGAIAVDEDGSHVYFAALGQLVEGKGRTYAENAAGFGSANVYLYREDEALSYVTTLAEHGSAPASGSVGDLLSGAALMRRGLAWTANTSADGGELLFMSSRELTDYETGGIDKFAAYLYSADSDRLVCVSCRSDGMPLSAVHVSGGTEGAHHQSSWLLAGPQPGGYRARSMSADGAQVIFSSPDPLAPGAESGKRNVYLWRQGQVSLLAVAEHGGVNGLRGYRDMSADGEDIFIATGQQLVPEDQDFISDVYDVRVGGGYPFREPESPCQVHESDPLQPNQVYCQNDRALQPPPPAPASSGFQGPGNLTYGKPRPSACRKGKVRRRGKCIRRPQQIRSDAKRHQRSAPEKGQRRSADTDRGGAK